jgi:hypothetical protein
MINNIDEADRFSTEPFVRFRIEIAQVMSTAMAQCKLTHAEVAKKMSALLGRKISTHMLDAYASDAKVGHTPSMDVAIAFDMAINSCALSNYLAGKLGGKVAVGNDILFMELGRIAKERADLAVREGKIRSAAKISAESAIAETRLNILDEDNIAMRMVLAWLVSKHPGDDALNFLSAKIAEQQEGGVIVFPHVVSTLESIRDDAMEMRSHSKEGAV